MTKTKDTGLYDGVPWAEFIKSELGWNPEDTESSARQVAVAAARYKFHAECKDNVLDEEAWNKFQLIAIEHYGGGDYQYLKDKKPSQVRAAEIGDTLFVFLLRELSDDGMDVDTTMARMETVVADINEVIAKIEEASNDPA